MKCRDFIETIKTTVQAIRWIMAEKRKLEANTQAYLSTERADKARLWLETLAKTLEEGEAHPNFKTLPKPVRWFCGGSKIDNYVGTFGQRVLKSQKLADDNPILHKDGYGLFNKSSWRGLNK